MRTTKDDRMDMPTDVSGKRMILTGATDGIGLAAAKALAAAGAELTIVARNPEKARATVAEITTAQRGSQREVVIADLSVQADVRRAAAEIAARYPHIDALVNNAGAMYSPRSVTVDGIEMTWAVNHLAPFLLTTLLLDRLKQSAPARIVTTSSAAHIGAIIPFDDINAASGYRSFDRYGQSKLANILFTTELARRLAGTGVTANCYHPGFVATRFNRNNGVLMGLGMMLAKPFARTPEKGAETLVWLATAPEAAGMTGGYFFDRTLTTPSLAAQDTEWAERLWQISEQQVAASALVR
jgi:NAD(P)-dependent dehydrogenase (short-subunit alcohol dehydrogenase family)